MTPYEQGYMDKMAQALPPYTPSNTSRNTTVNSVSTPGITSPSPLRQLGNTVAKGIGELAYKQPNPRIVNMLSIYDAIKSDNPVADYAIPEELQDKAKSRATQIMGGQLRRELANGAASLGAVGAVEMGLKRLGVTGMPGLLAALGAREAYGYFNSPSNNVENRQELNRRLAAFRPQTSEGSVLKGGLVANSILHHPYQTGAELIGNTAQGLALQREGNPILELLGKPIPREMRPPSQYAPADTISPRPSLGQRIGGRLRNAGLWNWNDLKYKTPGERMNGPTSNNLVPSTDLGISNNWNQQ